MSRSNVKRQLSQLKIANVIRIIGMEISMIDDREMVDIAQAPLSED
jgi:hypothetical protein